MSIHTSYSLHVQRGRNRPKPEKVFLKPENCYFNWKFRLDRKLKPEKGISKPENCYFNQKITLDRKHKSEKGIPKPENCYFNWKITLDRKPKPEKVFPKQEKVFLKPKNCFCSHAGTWIQRFWNRKRVIVTEKSKFVTRKLWIYQARWTI